MIDNEKIIQFLDGQQYMMLAIVAPNITPWAVPARIGAWQGREFEWDSKLDTVHSQALDIHPAMAITVFDTTTQTAFYATGVGELLHDRGDGYGRY